MGKGKGKKDGKKAQIQSGQRPRRSPNPPSLGQAIGQQIDRMAQGHDTRKTHDTNKPRHERRR